MFTMLIWWQQGIYTHTHTHTHMYTTFQMKKENYLCNWCCKHEHMKFQTSYTLQWTIKEIIRITLYSNCKMVIKSKWVPRSYGKKIF
jgi:hypothetical protein